MIDFSLSLFVSEDEPYYSETDDELEDRGSPARQSPHHLTGSRYESLNFLLINYCVHLIMSPHSW